MTTAEDVTQRHAQAINNRDRASYLATMNFPFTYQNYTGVALTVATAADCGVEAPWPWAIILTTDPHWHQWSGTSPATSSVRPADGTPTSRASRARVGRASRCQQRKEGSSRQLS